MKLAYTTALLAFAITVFPQLASGQAFTSTVTVSTSSGTTTLNGGTVWAFVPSGTVTQTAPGTGSIEVGTLNVASGVYSVALGDGNSATGSSSTAFGFLNAAGGAYSLTGGHGTIANGSEGFAFGYYSYSYGTAGTAFGISTKSNAYADFVLGQYNVGPVNTANSGGTTWFTGGSGVAPDPVFEIGDGLSGTTRADALTVYKDGTMAVQNTVSAPSFVTTANPNGTTDIPMFGR